MENEAAEIAQAIAERWEGFRAYPYLCPAGVASIGFGFTHYEDGSAVQLTDPPISRARAKRMLAYFIRTQYLPAVLRLCPNINEAGRLAAITDFCFNLGAGTLRSSNLRKRILADEWDEVPTQLRRWVRGGGKVLRGLVLRREDEISRLG